MQRHTTIFVFLILLLFSACSSEQSDQSKETKSVRLFEQLDTDQTGIDFKNSLTLEEQAEYMNYDYTINGAGLAVGDLNNDGYNDVVIGAPYDEEGGKIYIYICLFKVGVFLSRYLLKAIDYNNVCCEGMRTNCYIFELRRVHCKCIHTVKIQGKCSEATLFAVPNCIRSLLNNFETCLQVAVYKFLKKIKN